jgi:Nucleotidyltransferase substrate binding protein like
MKKVLTFHGIDTDNARDVFRETAKLKFITSAEIWFSYLDKRNITVHTYRKEILDSLFFSITEEFLKDLDYFLEKLAKEGLKHAPNGN